VQYVIAALIVVTVAQTWLLWRLVRMMGLLTGFDERLSRTVQGLELLVDTTEAGFAMLSAAERARAAEEPPARGATKNTTRRIVNAARRGKDVPQIAAREGLSEGEVRLRVHLAKSKTSADSSRAGEARAAAVRV
jgi:DNA-binding NarL/FixJ family response regulator